MGGEVKYNANAFAPETGARVHSGVVRIFEDRVTFEGGLVSGTLPFAGLRPRRGGHNDEQVFFEHPQHAGWSIYSSDEALLRDPILNGHPQFSQIVKGAARARKSAPPTVYIGLGLFVLFLAALVGLWLSKDRIAEFVAKRVPMSWEEKLGDHVFQGIAAQGKLLTNSSWADPVARLTDRLLPAVKDSGYTFKFHIMQDTNVNAFAIPGGHVVILTGLLERAESAEEVAGVLAHELAHVTRRHSLRNMVKSAGLILLIQSLLGDATGLVALATEGSRYLLQQKFSRDFEREADDYGWNYLMAARIDPRGMIRFFEKIKQMTEQAGLGAMEGSLAMLNTHPASQERIERLSAKWEAMADKTAFLPLEPLKRR